MDPLYKAKMKVHAIDPETKHWLLATILNVETSRIKVSWNGYSKSYDCWVPVKNVRTPIIKRVFQNKKILLKTDPKYLERGDKVFDTRKGKNITVEVNDPFKGEVRNLY